MQGFCYCLRPVMVASLEEQQIALAEVQLSDFRSKNLIALVQKRIVPGRVIDVGCGGGGMVVSLMQRGYDARGIDSSEPIISAARAFLTRQGCDPSRVGVAAVEQLVARGEQFENVLSMDCLEHQADDAPLFDALVRLTKPGGRLLVTVPAVPGLFSERDRAVGHYRRYTRARLRELAAGCPLRIVELRYWNAIGVPPTWLHAVVLGSKIDESFRYGAPSLRKRALRAGLSLWFAQVENRIRPPLGLTLFMVAARLPE
jgi:2-polyprenyl-3-methyl-5-hydroxy-6-metoxy-1,4-benzoquinol methylase